MNRVKMIPTILKLRWTDRAERGRSAFSVIFSTLVDALLH